MRGRNRKRCVEIVTFDNVLYFPIETNSGVVCGLLSNEEAFQRKRESQRRYYLKKKEQKVYIKCIIYININIF